MRYLKQRYFKIFIFSFAVTSYNNQDPDFERYWNKKVTFKGVFSFGVLNLPLNRCHESWRIYLSIDFGTFGPWERKSWFVNLDFIFQSWILNIKALQYGTNTMCSISAKWFMPNCRWENQKYGLIHRQILSKIDSELARQILHAKRTNSIAFTSRF